MLKIILDMYKCSSCKYAKDGRPKCKCKECCYAYTSEYKVKPEFTKRGRNKIRK